MLFSLAVASGLAQDYFPLHVGNQWVYRQVGRIAGEPLVVEVAAAQEFNGRFYSMLRGLPEGPAWLRQDQDGVLYRFDPDSMQETVWARFATPEGQTYRTEINPCNATASVESRNEKVTVPAGEFQGALRISYPAANCADAGLTDDTFLPWIGLIKRTSLTIAGPHSLELAYARIGGVTVLGEPEVSFTLTLDRAAYEPGQTMTVRFTVRATQAEPLALPFNSGQRFDLAFRNDRGDVVFQWSRERGFAQVLGTELVRGERNWVVRVPVPTASGTYAAEGWITTTAPRAFRSLIGFTVAQRQ